jgi:hypothetical protein
LVTLGAFSVLTMLLIAGPHWVAIRTRASSSARTAIVIDVNAAAVSAAECRIVVVRLNMVASLDCKPLARPYGMSGRASIRSRLQGDVENR